MTEKPPYNRKPKNLPWIILGVLGGTLLLGLFCFGVYTGAKSVSNELSVTYPKKPEPSERSDVKNTVIVFIDENNNIFIDDVSAPNLDSLTSFIQSMEDKTRDETVFILRFSEKASHKSLVSIRDMLDQYNIKSKIEIIREQAE